MYKRIFLSFLASLSFMCGYSQQKTFTLKEMLDMAVQHHPATSQKDYVKELGQENEKLLHDQLYPGITLTEQSTFQNEVTAIDIPGFTSPKKDNYNVGVDVRLPLTQFGEYHAQQAIEQAKTTLGIDQLDAELQRTKELVTNLYGNILLQKENKDVLLIRRSDLEAQRKKIAVGVTNGTVLKSNQLVFESEILITDQKVEDADATLLGLAQQLSVLTGIQVSPGDTFRMPEDAVSNKTITRPETKVFNDQRTLLDLQAGLLKKENQPKVFIFGQGFFGRPGYNFLDVSLRPYGMVGVGMTFNINNLLTQPRRLKLIDINKQIISRQEETFNGGLQSVLDPKKTEISKYESIISKDEQILSNRKEIIRAANSQLENGVITSTEYLTELNAENNAQLNLTLHKVQLALAVAQYNTLLGIYDAGL
jgi:outer membrane protein TolC